MYQTEIFRSIDSLICPVPFISLLFSLSCLLLEKRRQSIKRMAEWPLSGRAEGLGTRRDKRHERTLKRLVEQRDVDSRCAFPIDQRAQKSRPRYG